MDDKSPAKTSPPPPPPLRAQVKKENEEEIKEFAETAMNELLGWYGYERLELRRWAASSPDAADTKSKEECSWCSKSVSGEGGGGALQQGGAAFCSEQCFSQSRRANFKRAKTCDWCRHVRHTVAYVDFQDGATQLQFCSDKCLNQYKMHIFCRETQAHLDLNPHLVTASSSSSLITPELWLNNCRSRSPSPSPVSERSVSPNPENMSTKQTPEKPEAPKTQTTKSPLPLITIAPTAKLMKPKAPSEEKTPPKSQESKKDLRNIKMNLRKRRTSKCSATVTSQTLRQHSTTPKAQDLRMCSPPGDQSPPASTIGNGAMHSPPHPMNSHPLPPQPFPNPMFMPPPGFMEGRHAHMNEHRHPNIFPPRLNFIPRPMLPIPQDRTRLTPPFNFPPVLGQPPPVTVMVPYPVVLPVPIPIPVPLPLTAFIQAHCTNKVKAETRSDDTEGPLDFTMNSDKKKDEISTSINDKVSDEQVCEQTCDLNDRIQEDKIGSETSESGNPEQTLPKFKITRLGTKMAKIVAKSREPSESSRPLRKRRRLVEVTSDDDPLLPKTRKIVQV